MNNQTQLIYNDLRTRYKKATLSKAEIAYELGVSIATLDRYIKNGYGLPNYKKIGNSKAKNGRLIFNIIDVAEFLSQTIKVA